MIRGESGPVSGRIDPLDTQMTTALGLSVDQSASNPAIRAVLLAQSEKPSTRGPKVGLTTGKGRSWPTPRTVSGRRRGPDQADAAAASDAPSRRRMNHFSISTAMNGTGVASSTSASSPIDSDVVSKIGCSAGT